MSQQYFHASACANFSLSINSQHLIPLDSYCNKNIIYLKYFFRRRSGIRKNCYPVLLVLFILILFSSPVFAGEEKASAETDDLNPGSDKRGLTVSIGYNGSLFHYEETADSGAFLDKDTGWIGGVTAELQYETKFLFVRGLYEFPALSNAKYKGSLQDGTPYNTGTKEKLYRVEGDLGYKLFNSKNSTLTLYGGIGYRKWERGENVAPDYLETYSWNYYALGANYVWNHGKWSIGADAAVQIPFNMNMKTEFGLDVDEAALRPKSNLNFRAELPITYDISVTEHSKFFFFVAPYYEYWNIGKSDTVILQKDGIPAIVYINGKPYNIIAYLPKSETHMFGFKVGLGVNF